MASPKTSRGLSDNCGSRWLTTISRCHIAVSASHYQSLSQREAQDRCDVGNRSLQPWRLDLRIMSGRRLNCCPIAFRLTSWIPYPIWSGFTRRLRKLITAVKGHYPLAQLLAKPRVAAQFIIAGDPAVRHLVPPRVEHLQTLVLARLIAYLQWHMAFLTSLLVPCPVFGQGQAEVE